MESDLERMYRAGREEMPAAAERLTRVVNSLHDRLGELDTQSALAGDPQILRSMLQVGGDTHDVLRQGVATMYDAATAVILTADNFRATDEDAREDYQNLDRRLKNTPNPTEPTPPPVAGDPEDPGAPGTPSTPDPVDPDQDRSDRDNAGVDPLDRWGH